MDAPLLALTRRRPGAPSGPSAETVAAENMRQLIQLRWIAVAGQTLAILFVHFGLRVPLPVVAVLKVVFDRSNHLKHWGVLFGDERPPKSPFAWPRYRKASQSVQQEIKEANDTQQKK